MSGSNSGSGSAVINPGTVLTEPLATPIVGTFQPYTVLTAEALNAALLYGNKLGGELENVTIGLLEPNVGHFTELTARTPPAGDNSQNVATTAWIQNQFGLFGGTGTIDLANFPVTVNNVTKTLAAWIAQLLLGVGTGGGTTPPPTTVVDPDAILNSTGGVITLSDGSELIHAPYTAPQTSVDPNAILNSTGGSILLSNGAELISTTDVVTPPSSSTNRILNQTNGQITVNGSILSHP